MTSRTYNRKEELVDLMGYQSGKSPVYRSASFYLRGFINEIKLQNVDFRGLLSDFFLCCKSVQRSAG